MNKQTIILLFLGSLFLFLGVTIYILSVLYILPLDYVFWIIVALSILAFLMFFFSCCCCCCNTESDVTACRLLLICPIMPCIWMYYAGNRTGLRIHKPSFLERCCALRRPGARQRHVVERKKAPEEGFSWYLHSYLACCIQWGCCVLNLTKDIPIRDAINRYVEGPKKTWPDLLQSIENNKYLSYLIEYLSQSEPKFYFRILPSGSIREGFGYPLPSTSVLASDYDLMLVPDGIFVYDEFTEREGRFPASFTAIDDPNQNPERPKGFLWLKLEKTVNKWKYLCYERMTPDGGMSPYCSFILIVYFW